MTPTTCLDDVRFLRDSSEKKDESVRSRLNSSNTINYFLKFPDTFASSIEGVVSIVE